MRNPSKARGWGRRAPSIRLAGILALAIAAASASLCAQEGKGWIGKQVVQRSSDFSLRVGSKVERMKDFEAYRVEKVSGPWLGLRSFNHAGWASATDVIPIEQAIGVYSDAIRKSPKDDQLYVLRSAAREAHGEFDEALDDASEAVRLAPDKAGNLVGRAVIFLKKKDYRAAITDLDAALRRDRQSGPAYNTRGVVRGALGEFDAAIADFDIAIRLQPRCPRFFANRGFTRANKEDFDEAIADLNEAIRLDPDLAVAYLRRGIVENWRKRPDQAMADLDHAIRLDVSSSEAFKYRAIFHYQRGRFAQSVSDLETAARLDPKDLSFLNNAAWIRATCPDPGVRDGKLAVDFATKVCEADGGKDPNTLGTFAAACAEAGDFARAVELRAKANAMLKDAKAKKKGEEQLKLYQEKTPYREAKP